MTEPATQRFVVAEDDLVFLKRPVETQKFNEADWVRNRGRFADFIGRRQGGGGGAGSSGSGEPGDPLKFDPVWLGGADAVQKKLVPHYADWAATVTSAEREALIGYASESGEGNYHEINGYLRNPGDIRSQFIRRPEPYRSEAIATAQERQAKTIERIAVLDSALAKASSPEMLVYRGFGFEGRNMAVGDAFLDKGFTSTSANIVNAADFGFGGGSLGPTTVGEIRVPKGSKAVAVNAIINPSGDPETHVPGTRNEAEVILNRGGVYRVVGERRETVEYDTPSGNRQSKEVNILEIEMVEDTGNVPPLGRSTRARRGRRYDRFTWSDGDVVMLTPEPPVEKVRRLLPDTLKFVESDWVRNSGRFADFVGQSGGGGGAGASGGKPNTKAKPTANFVETATEADFEAMYTVRGLRAKVVDVEKIVDGKYVAQAVNLELYDIEGNKIAFMRRHFQDNGIVHHTLFEVQGQNEGIAALVNQHAESAYREHGFTKIELTADIDIGKYAWARQGYDFTSESERNRRTESARDIYRNSLREANRGISDEEVNLRVDALFKRRSLNAWEIASLDDGQQYEYVSSKGQRGLGHIGKQIMLGGPTFRAEEWRGVKDIRDGSKGRSVGDAYFAQRVQTKVILTPGWTWVEAFGVSGPEVWDLEADDSWFLEAVRRP